MEKVCRKWALKTISRPFLILVNSSKTANTCKKLIENRYFERGLSKNL